MAFGRPMDILLRTNPNAISSDIMGARHTSLGCVLMIGLVVMAEELDQVSALPAGSIASESIYGPSQPCPSHAALQKVVRELEFCSILEWGGPIASLHANLSARILCNPSADRSQASSNSYLSGRVQSKQVLSDRLMMNCSTILDTICAVAVDYLQPRSQEEISA